MRPFVFSRAFCYLIKLLELKLASRQPLFEARASALTLLLSSPPPTHTRTLSPPKPKPWFSPCTVWSCRAEPRCCCRSVRAFSASSLKPQPACPRFPPFPLHFSTSVTHRLACAPLQPCDHQTWTPKNMIFFIIFFAPIALFVCFLFMPADRGCKQAVTQTQRDRARERQGG